VNRPNLRRLAALLACAAGLSILSFCQALACACGCGVFDVGTSSLFPTGSGGQAFFEYDFMDQNQNRSGPSSAPASDNSDKEIRTNFFTVGAQYMFNHEWGVMVEAPYWTRTFKTDDGTGAIDAFNGSAVGDIRLKGMYTGFSHDMSTGITFGVKLPTGDYGNANFDRDTQIGTGSTDILIGGFHRGALTPDNAFSYFVQAQWDQPVASQGGYTPGNELDAAVGAHYNGFTTDSGKIRITPVVQLLVSQRARDNGVNADPADSGYTRAIVSPGVEFGMGDWSVYADVEVPVYQYYNGDQLAGPEAVKIIVSRNF
jgi:hypothetical protein